MPEATFDRLAPLLEPVDLPRTHELARMDEPFSHCYFIESGISSIVAKTPEKQSAEVGLVGREGITPTGFILDTQITSYDIFMQVPGNGYRIECAALGAALEEDEITRRLMLRFVQTLTTQGSYTALSNAVHSIDERLARWILMCHDRVDNDEIALTHEFMSVMLAVRRPSVTTGLHVLEGNRFIYSERGVLTVRDRVALEAFANDAYGVAEGEYRRLVGPFGKGSPETRVG